MCTAVLYLDVGCAAAMSSNRVSLNFEYAIAKKAVKLTNTQYRVLANKRGKPMVGVHVVGHKVNLNDRDNNTVRASLID